MGSPMNFHPEDPTVWLWKKLLRHYPGKGRVKKTKAQKKAAALSVQQYYVDRVHPRKGKDFGKKK